MTRAISGSSSTTRMFFIIATGPAPMVRTLPGPIALHAPGVMMPAVPEGTAWTTEAIERALAPSDVADAAENHQPPGEIRTVVVAPHPSRLPLAALDQGVPVAIFITVIDQPEPTQ